VITRDIAIVATVAIINLAVGRRTFRPSLLGKLATVTYIATGVVTLTFNFLDRASLLVTACIYASLAITIVSALDYARRTVQIINQHS
jgi:hypothetical protein